MTTMIVERLVIANQVEELRRMSQWIADGGAAAGVSKEVIGVLDFCANEAVTNIISYAYDDAIRHEITLDLTATQSGATILIKDDGRPFNVLEAPKPKSPATLAEAEIGGLGIHLIRCMVSRCEYRRENGYNVLQLEASRGHIAGNA